MGKLRQGGGLQLGQSTDHPSSRVGCPVVLQPANSTLIQQTHPLPRSFQQPCPQRCPRRVPAQPAPVQTPPPRPAQQRCRGPYRPASGRASCTPWGTAAAGPPPHPQLILPQAPPSVPRQRRAPQPALHPPRRDPSRSRSGCPARSSPCLGSCTQTGRSALYFAAK